MSVVMEDEIKRWTAKRKGALVLRKLPRQADTLEVEILASCC